MASEAMKAALRSIGWYNSEGASTSPSGAIRAVTPADDTDLPDGPCRGIAVGTAGPVKITDLTGSDVVVYCVQGANPYAAVRIWADGTDAEDIVALY